MRDVTLFGLDWDRSTVNITDAGVARPIRVSGIEVPIRAAIVTDVVAVYEKEIRIERSSLYNGN